MSNKPVFPRWTNPYIDRVESLPGLLAACYGGAPSDEERGAFAHKLGRFSRRFAELGCGSGMHLVERASRDRDSLYVGFELRYKRAFKTAMKAQRAGLDNVFIFRCDARQLDTFFPEGSLCGTYVNFPDPWDKKRWEENRIIGERLLSQLETRLTPQGFLAYKTDHAERFQEVLEMLRANQAFELTEVTEDLWSTAWLEGNVGTEFEALFRSQQLPICYLKALRKNS